MCNRPALDPTLHRRIFQVLHVLIRVGDAMPEVLVRDRFDRRGGRTRRIGGNNMQAVRSRKQAAVRRGRDRMSHMAGMLAKAQLLHNARRAQPNRKRNAIQAKPSNGATSAIVLQG